MPYTSRSEQNGTQHLCKPLALEVLFVLANVYSNAVALLPRTIWPSNASRACSNNWSAMLVGYAGLGYVSVVLRPRASAVQVPAITGDCLLRRVRPNCLGEVACSRATQATWERRGP
jgi:hypothetical protein